MKYKVLIFDWDGTLFDSIEMIQKSLQGAFADLDLPVPSAEDARHIVGLGVKESLEYLHPGLSDTQKKKLALRYRDHYISRENEGNLFEGVVELLDELKQQNYTLTVATGKSRNGLNRVLDYTEMGHAFETTRTADETAAKPDPKMLHEIVAELQVSVDDCVMIGDTTYDLEMAQRIGMHSLAVLTGAHTAEKMAGYSQRETLPHVSHIRDFI